jgi:hypothetical protein
VTVQNSRDCFRCLGALHAELLVGVWCYGSAQRLWRSLPANSTAATMVPSPNGFLIQEIGLAEVHGLGIGMAGYEDGSNT